MFCRDAKKKHFCQISKNYDNNIIKSLIFCFYDFSCAETKVRKLIQVSLPNLQKKKKLFKFFFLKIKNALSV